MAKILDEKINEREPYRSILNLISFDGRNGLTHGQILERLKEGDKESDSWIYKYGLVKRGCVKSTQRLTEQLRLLVKRKFIKRERNPRYYLYFPSSEYLHHIHIKDIISWIKSYKIDKVLDMQSDRFGVISIYSLFGFPDEGINNLSKEDSLQVIHELKVIDNILRKIKKKTSSGSLDFHWHI